MPSRPPLHSINENIDYRAEQYHVQTEDDVGSFTTHLYRGGVIIATEVGDYTDRNLEVVREKMVAQHEGVKNRLYGREFDEKIAALEAEKRAVKRRTRTRRMSSKRYRPKDDETAAAAKPLPEAPPPKKRRKRDRTTEEVSAVTGRLPKSGPQEAASRSASLRATGKAGRKEKNKPAFLADEPRTRSRVDLPSVLAADSKLPTDATIVDAPLIDTPVNPDDTFRGDSVEMLPTDATLIDVQLDSLPEPETPIEEIPTRPVSAAPRARARRAATPAPAEAPVRVDAKAAAPAATEAAKRPRTRVRLPTSETRLAREVPSEEIDIRTEILARNAEQVAEEAARKRPRIRLPSTEAAAGAAGGPKPVEEAPNRSQRVRLPSAETPPARPGADRLQRPRRESTEVRAASPQEPDSKRPLKAQPTPARRPPRPAPSTPSAPPGAPDRSIQEMFLDYLVKDED